MSLDFELRHNLECMSSLGYKLAELVPEDLEKLLYIKYLYKYYCQQQLESQLSWPLYLKQMSRKRMKDLQDNLQHLMQNDLQARVHLQSSLHMLRTCINC